MKNKELAFLAKIWAPIEKWMDKNKETARTIKFVLISASAGIIQIISSELFVLIGLPVPMPYLLSLIISVIWNFTINRRYTFQSASNIPKAMLLVALFYCVFTPLSTYADNYMVNTLGWPIIVGQLACMGCNLITEYLYDTFVVYRGKMDNNDLAAKQRARESAELSSEATSSDETDKL